MTSESDDLERALQENLKLRRELATRWPRSRAKNSLRSVTDWQNFGALRYAFSGRIRRASVSATVVELMT